MQYLKVTQPNLEPKARRPTGFGTPFGTTTTTASGFGGFGSTSFGAPAPTSTAFSSTFGTPAASATPVFGSTFGAPISSTTVGFGTPGPSTAPAFGTPGPSTAPAFGAPGPSTAPAFGSTFGTPATAIPAFGSTFGATATSAPTFGSTFGTPVSSAPSLFGTPAAKPSLFGTPATTGNLFATPATTSSLFGTSVTTQAPNLFGTTTTPSLFGTTSTPSLFGGGTTFGAPTTSAPTFTGGLFGTAPSFGTSTGLFGGTTTTTSAPSLFGGFGAPNTGGFGNFGGTGAFGTATTTATPNFGFNLAPPKPAVPSLPAFSAADIKLQQFYASINNINLFGDDRDRTVKKWNMLQAAWGTGKGFYSFSQPPVEYDNTNPHYRFRAIAYVVIPQPDNADGLVKMHFNRKESDLSPQRDVLMNGITGILGNKPNLIVNIEHIKALSDTDSEVMISVSERGVTGASRKIYASDLSMFLNQPLQKQQLTNVGVTFIGPYMAPTKAQIVEYLKMPPPGIEMGEWQAAQIDNPNPQKYLPAPVFGFTDLKKRLVCQEYETGLHRAFLEKAIKDIMELKTKQVNTIAKLAERKQTLLELQHRVLKIIIKQESVRKAGMAFQPEEEVIRGRMENVRSQLGISTQYRGRLQELMSSVTLMDRLQSGPSHQEHYRIDPNAKEDIRQFLQLEQQGIKEVVKTINKDLKDLKIMQDGLNETLNSNNK